MATVAFDHARQISEDVHIGQAYLMSTQDDYFLFDIQILQDRLFLIETGRDEPKSIAYNLDTMFCVTSDTRRQPSVQNQLGNLSIKKDEITITKQSLYSAKIICNNGVHRRLFFKEYDHMNAVLE